MKTDNTIIRHTPKEKEQWKNAANGNLSLWVRETLNKAAKKQITKKEKEQMKQKPNSPKGGV